jgi:hypothetical protein
MGNRNSILSLMGPQSLWKVDVDHVEGLQYVMENPK